MPDAAEKTWKDRITEELSRDTPTAGEVACALEAYAEMKCVRLKVLLARCYELMNASESRDEAVSLNPGFLDVVLDASK